jgi:hypothetical protein
MVMEMVIVNHPCHFEGMLGVSLKVVSKKAEVFLWNCGRRRSLRGIETRPI